MTENEIAKIVVDTAFHIHQDLGPGLLESVYENVLVKQLRKRALAVDRQVPISFSYDGDVFDEGFRADLIVEKSVIIELKSVTALLPIHTKQLQTYLKLTGMKLGLLMNFNTALIKDGIHRCVNGL